MGRRGVGNRKSQGCSTKSSSRQKRSCGEPPRKGKSGSATVSQRVASRRLGNRTRQNCCELPVKSESLATTAAGHKSYEEQRQALCGVSSSLKKEYDFLGQVGNGETEDVFPALVGLLGLKNNPPPSSDADILQSPPRSRTQQSHTSVLPKPQGLRIKPPKNFVSVNCESSSSVNTTRIPLKASFTSRALIKDGTIEPWTWWEERRLDWALGKHGCNWNKVARMVGTRPPSECKAYSLACGLASQGDRGASLSKKRCAATVKGRVRELKTPLQTDVKENTFQARLYQIIQRTEAQGGL
mmetsp:Transcript_20121/g.35758  ORF Transcript_20121/g.35758 Transcript_20121/m.35758 type:complete len:298 (-) Transcript_20121:29-922(-)